MEFQHLVDESEIVKALTEELKTVAQSLEETSASNSELFSEAKVVDFDLTQQNQNLVGLKMALEGLMKEMQARKLKTQDFSTRRLEIEERLQLHQDLVALLEAQQQSLQMRLSQVQHGSKGAEKIS